MSPTQRRLLPRALALLAALVVVIVVTGGDDGYRVRMVLENSEGVREGTGVRVGGVEAGSVARIDLDDQDRVVIEAELDEGKGPVGKNASVSISSLNLLGQKFLEIDKGDVEDPAESGSTISRGRVTESTDLDQVLRVLDPDTRALLGVLMNEAGIAMTGRREDVQLLLRKFPTTERQITDLADRLAGDNRTLGTLVERSDRFIAHADRKRADLVEMVDVLGQASASFAQSRPALQQTLRRAPGTLRTAQRFLADLRKTASPLGPAARNLSATAPSLRETLTKVEPFARAVAPTLDKAGEVAPLLTRLGSRATPVVKRAATTASALSRYSASAQPASQTLDGSIDNLTQILDEWRRALPYRDTLSHIFRAESVVTTQTVQALIDQIENAQKPKRKKRDGNKHVGKKPDGRPGGSSGSKTPAKDLVDGVVGDTKETLDAMTDNLLRKLKPPADSGTPPSRGLLDFLLGP